MQKLISVYLDSLNFRDDRKESWHQRRGDVIHGLCEEHLDEYLKDGWMVKSISSFGGHGESSAYDGVRGFVMVLLEK